MSLGSNRNTGGERKVGKDYYILSRSQPYKGGKESLAQGTSCSTVRSTEDLWFNNSRDGNVENRFLRE